MAGQHGGGLGKCEKLGSDRFDNLIEIGVVPPRRPGPAREQGVTGQDHSERCHVIADATGSVARRMEGTYRRITDLPHLSMGNRVIDVRIRMLLLPQELIRRVEADRCVVEVGFQPGSSINMVEMPVGEGYSLYVVPLDRFLDGLGVEGGVDDERFAAVEKEPYVITECPEREPFNVSRRRGIHLQV